MKGLFQKVSKFGSVVLVSGVVGYCVAKATISEAYISKKVDSYVSEAYEKEGAKFRAEFEITCTNDGKPAEISDVFSKEENFKPTKIEKTLLEKKVGFRYEVSDKTCKKTGYKTILGSDHIAYFGQDYIFKLEASFNNGVDETLSIYNFTGDFSPTASIYIYDNDHNGTLERISILDKVNNTSILISRDSEGNMEYDNISEDGAKQLYELYTLKFNSFKMLHGIDRAILDYQPKLEIKEIKPPKE